MIDALKELDTRFLLFLNSFHNSFFDQLMWLVSDKFTWVPLYIWFLWLLYKKYKSKFWMVLVMITLMIVLSDQMANLFKNGFMRLRPSNEPAIRHLIHIVNGYTGGPYGFYSGHAANAFAVATFVILMLGKEMKYLVWICLSYATLVSYSRIYLGVHYPLDVLTGAIAGILTGGLMVRGLEKWMKSGLLQKAVTRIENE
ncbi:MAG: phosphatase PAP2 family protein [Bacteroidales bacterium]|nr:phosphatase PAP2 family protein [Bacteroidales bacterium]